MSVNIYDILGDDTEVPKKQQAKAERVPKIAEAKPDNVKAKANAKPNAAGNAGQSVSNHEHKKGPAQSVPLQILKDDLDARVQGRGNSSGQARVNNRGRGRGESEASQGTVAEPPRSNAPKDRDRRIREHAQRQGYYGAPDVEGHIKRPYDRFSHSAASFTREGSKEKKGGQGPRNWGSKDTTPEEPLEDTAPEAAETEKPEEQAGAPEGGEEKAEAPQPEEEKQEVDFQTFLERKRKEEEETNQLIAVDIRKVEEADFKDMKPLEKVDEDFFPIDGKRKTGNKKSPSGNRNEKVNVDDVLNVQPSPENRRGRGRQQDRQRQSRGRGGQVSLSLTDDRDFPSLGIKA
jgi:hypothetical protein